jgi:hypothetical protein
MPRSPGAPLLLALSLAAPLATTLAGCHSRQAPDTGRAAGPAAAALHAGGMPFAFDPAAVGELQIDKADRSRGDAWTVTLRREGGGWRIAAPPVGTKLADARADGAYVDHLLETLRTLQIAERSPEDSLEPVGLAPPRFVLRWSAAGAGRELRVGQESPSGGDYAQFDADPRVWIVRGSALAMLERLEDFGAVRLRTLLTAGAEDLRAFEYRARTYRPVRTRLGRARWQALPTLGLTSEGVRRWVEALAHLRAMRFVDDPAVAGGLRERIEAAPGWQLRFEPVHGKPIELRVRELEGALWATVSSRPGVAFELFPESRPHLTPPKS